MSESKWEKLQGAVNASGISIKDVAEAASIAQSSIFRAMNGSTKAPRVIRPGEGISTTSTPNASARRLAST